MGFRILHVLEPAINLFPFIEKPNRFVNNK
jgi:hypothetical protein